jgi:hypothetical protein
LFEGRMGHIKGEDTRTGGWVYFIVGINSDVECLLGRGQDVLPGAAEVGGTMEPVS